LIINGEFFESLPLEYQEIIQEVISEAASIQRIENMETKQRKIDAVMAKGAKVHFVNKEAFKEKMAPVYDKWKKELGADFVEDFIQAVEEIE
jgi:TRAP-type C4-dicarboxylate transport system substrate-binding protein